MQSQINISGDYMHCSQTKTKTDSITILVTEKFKLLAKLVTVW